MSNNESKRTEKAIDLIEENEKGAVVKESYDDKPHSIGDWIIKRVFSYPWKVSTYIIVFLSLSLYLLIVEILW